MKFLGVPSSGSTAGTTFSHNRAGQYTRNRRTPVVGTRTPRQAVIKGNMTTSSQSWQLLTSAQMAAWTAYATGHPITDALGQSIKLTGHQYYIKCAAALLNVGGVQPTAPPLSSTVVPESIVQFQVDTSGTFVVERTAGAALDWVAIAVSKPTSLGVNFQKTFHQVGAFAASTVFCDVSTAALAFMGTFAVGTKAWVRVTPVNEYGLTGTAVIMQTPIVTISGIATPVATSAVATGVTSTWSSVPTPANIVFERAVTATGPWGVGTIDPNHTSPYAATGFTTGMYVRVRLQDPISGLFGPWSNSILVT